LANQQAQQRRITSYETPNLPSKVKYIDARESHNEKKQKIEASKLLQGQRTISDDQILDKII